MILTNEGLVERAKLTCGVAANAFTEIILGTESDAEDPTNTYGTFLIISTNGGARKACTCSYIGSYTAQWIANFSFTGSLGINSWGIVNSSNKCLLRKKFASTKNVVDGNTMRITATLVETRG